MVVLRAQISTSLPSWGCGTRRFWPPRCTWPWGSLGKHPKELLLLLCSSGASTMRVGKSKKDAEGRDKVVCWASCHAGNYFG